MTAAEALAWLLDAGITLRVEGGRLRAGPPALLTAERREVIRTHADALKALVAGGWPADTRVMFEALVAWNTRSKGVAR